MSASENPLTGSLQTGAPSEKWKHTAASCSVQMTHRTAIFLAYITPGLSMKPFYIGNNKRSI